MDIFTALKAFQVADLVADTDDISGQFVEYCQLLMDCHVQITFKGYTKDFNKSTLIIGERNIMEDIVDVFLSYNTDPDVDSFMQFVNDNLDEMCRYQMAPLFARFYPKHIDNEKYARFYKMGLDYPEIQKLKAEIDAKSELESKNDSNAELLEIKTRLAEMETKLANYKKYEIENLNLKKELDNLKQVNADMITMLTNKLSG